MTARDQQVLPPPMSCFCRGRVLPTQGVVRALTEWTRGVIFYAMSEILPLARTAGLTAEEVGGELLMYNEQGELVIRLNRAATLVWQSSDGNHTLRDLVAVLTEEFGELADEDQVLVALDELAKQGLIESGYDQRDPSAARLSRRQFVRRVGIVAAAAVSVPIVHGLVVPAPAAGATPHYHYHYRNEHHHHPPPPHHPH